jgi:hypothetical protein
MIIKVNTVEGKTNKAGSKQGRIYQIIKESSVKGFFEALTDTGKKMTIWNLKGDWSKIGICNNDCRRFSYSTDFYISE